MAVRLLLFIGSWIGVGAAIATVELIRFLRSPERQDDLQRAAYVQFNTRRIGWLLGCFYALDTLLWPIVVYTNARTERRP